MRVGFNMTFKDEIITSIQNTADNYGDSESVITLGASGFAWNRATGDKMQRMETIVSGYADTIMGRMVSRGKPFDGTLEKEIIEFSIVDNTITMEETYGMVTGDTFGVTGSLGNDMSFTVKLLNGNEVEVEETVLSNETISPPLKVLIDPPLTNLNIEDTLRKVQADIYDEMPISATLTIEGLVKQAEEIEKISSPGSTGELKVNEIIDSLTEASSMYSYTTSVPTGVEDVSTPIYIKTEDYSLVSTDSTILADATSNTVTITLPSSPIHEQVFTIFCINSTFTCTVGRNGNNINGIASDLTLLSTESVTLQFHSLYGWVIL